MSRAMTFTRRHCLTGLICAAAVPARAAPAAYALDPDGSDVRFGFRVGGVAATGTMPVARADIRLDFDVAARSTATVTLAAERAETGIALMDSALKGNDVLATDRYPDIGFSSTSFAATRGGAVVRGDVTVRDVTRPLTLQATIFRPPGSAPGDRSRLTVRLTGRIDRHAFGASGYAGLVDDIVTLDIRARLLRAD
jgi:polyisoprenoid-binding protein YceI